MPSHKKSVWDPESYFREQSDYGKMGMTVSDRISFILQTVPMDLVFGTYIAKCIPPTPHVFVQGDKSGRLLRIARINLLVC
jgi:hypothetical protein